MPAVAEEEQMRVQDLEVLAVVVMDPPAQHLTEPQVSSILAEAEEEQDNFHLPLVVAADLV
jgi:hypothetical protein